MRAAPCIDIHVHLIGSGSSGSGCWIRTRGWSSVLSRLMLHELGLPLNALSRDFDALYAGRIIEYVDASSLTHAVLLAHDRVYEANGRLIEAAGSFYVPNDYLLAVTARHPKLLPAVSIHPARSDALDELDRCAALGAVMMKCLPNCHNIDCRLSAYRPFWKKMADLKLPLLAHTGGELSVQVMDRALQNPEILREPLECGVTVVAAHVATASYPFDRDYFPRFCELICSYPNLYGDISALNSPFRSRALAACLHEPVLSRAVHGSDLPIPISGRYARWRGLISAEDFRRSKRQPNLLERDIEIKRAMGFPQSVFSRPAHFLRLPAPLG